MSRKTYRAVLIDLCDTLHRFNPERLPLVACNGSTFRSTSGVVHERLSQDQPGIPLERFIETLQQVTERMAEENRGELREGTSEERFGRCLTALGVATDAPRLARELVRVHMARIAAALELPEGRPELLRWLRERAFLALITNFDHSGTVYEILKRDLLEPFFDAVMVSSDLGRRKPHRRIFVGALEALRVEPEAALVVGDTPESDIAGAHAAGIDCAWFNPEGRPLPAGVAPPTYEIRDLDELRRFWPSP